jgi:hypothetical protein
MMVMHLIRHADQPYNLVAAMLLNDVNTSVGMATGTD